ncbi:hypothetical protein FXO38_32864 [Capsicum annuum]|nr:hypothetical protein FXO38_32864 [Capsicum annuum]
MYLNPKLGGVGGGLVSLYLSILGSGQISKDKYYYGFFNAALKLPAHFTFGAVVAFYVGSGSWSPQYKAAGLSTRRVSLLCIAYFCLGVFVVNRLLTGPVRMVNDDLSVEHMSQELHPVLECEKKARQFMPLVGMEWSQIGVAHLFSAIKMFKMKEEMKKVTKKLTLLE